MFQHFVSGIKRVLLLHEARGSYFFLDLINKNETQEVCCNSSHLSLCCVEQSCLY